MADERVWLRHDYLDAEPPREAGWFHCPIEAADDWKLLGWVEDPDGPPPPVSPVIAERLAWEAEQARLAEGAAAEEKAVSKPTTKSAARGDSKE